MRFGFQHLAVIFAVCVLGGQYSYAQNPCAQNAESQKSVFEPSEQNGDQPNLSVLIDAIFEDPTSLEKNFKLLEEQTRIGDLRGAAATLDRILLLDPDSKLARVLLAEVQFNLGNLATAETVLVSLRDDETTPPNMLERVEKNLNAIHDSQSPWRYSASFSVARGSAENPRGASASDTILITDIEVTNDTLDESEAYGETTLVGQVQYQLESQNPQVLKATAVAYHRDYMYYDAGDLSSLQAMLEYQKLAEPTLTFGTKFNHVAISEETYSATSAGYAEIGQTFFQRLKLNLYAETSHRHNFETSARSGARDYNGFTNRVTLSATTPVFGQAIKLTGGYKRSDPEAEIYQYTSRNVQVSTSWRFRKMTASISGGREWVHYRMPDPLISSNKREDVINTSSLALNLPFANQSRSITAKASYSSSESSLDNYDKDSADFQLALNVSLN